uniref:uncharacterized protein LOC117263700 isoform X1 n=1 Tax=Epinephelus lanceolatus TaxID=310571 RepID=UPI001447D440|nr:uncharacterized protein LOC117263700 isoform X1 [Epinephelus lanceolatus]XP_033493196.1 uncharacterized protein LOC117263700 isoform X1 [Epinephelus lanceolatus]
MPFLCEYICLMPSLFVGVSTKSQLFDSLKAYLNNPNRLQPIIGLGSILECVKAGTHNTEVLYLCEVCVCRLSKADMRNHIMGSLHRYNYIKAWHPHLVSEWKEKTDLSKLARPLMEMAKILEGKEGPGDVRWLEADDAVYQKLATHSENDAVTLITILRDGQGERESHSETVSMQQQQHYPIQSQRIVLLSQNPDTLKTTAKTNKTVAFIKSENWLKNTSPEPSVLSDYGNSFLDGYAGTKPLIGLFRMVECRSEDGYTHCFLCHCCRIRSNKMDIIDHLTTSSHVVNYLMETYPEQVEVMMADTDDSNQLLQSLAKRVEREEGRGEPKVVNVPESLCILMTGKSYHWCLRMLHSGGWTHAKNQKWKKAVKGPSVNKTLNQGMPEKCATTLSKRAERRKAKRKLRGVTNTVFKVSLPLTKGSVLLERTSVSKDSPSVTSGYSPSLDLDLSPPPESLSEDCELDCDSESFAVNQAVHTSQLQQDIYGGHEDTYQYMEPERNFTVTQYQEVDGCSSDNEYFEQSEDRTGTKYQMCGDKYYNRQHGSQESSSKRFYKEWQTEGSQTENKWLSSAASHAENWPSYNSSYRHEAGGTEQWYNPTTQSKVATRVSREERQNKISSHATQQYYQQQPKNQYMVQAHTSLQRGGVGQYGLSDELGAHADPARIYMHHRAGDSLGHSGSIAPEPRVRFLDNEQRQLQTYMEFTTGPVQTAQHSYMTQSTAHQAIQYSHSVMSNPNYNIGPRTNSDQRFPHPLNSGGGVSQSNTFIPPGQAPGYAPHSDRNFRATGFSDLRTSGSSGGTTPFMFEYPKF